MGKRDETAEALEDVLALAGAARDLKGNELLVLDVSRVTDLFRFVLIVSATSRRHAASLADELLAVAKKRKMFKLGVEGKEEASWILLDFTDVVVHLFLPEVRGYYNLEFLWADAPRVELP